MDFNLSNLGKKTLEEFNNIKNLPTIPKVVMEVNDMVRNHTGNVGLLAEAVGKDQGLTTKILTVANSPLYGLPKKVSSIEFAIMLLGMAEIANIVTALSLASVVQGRDVEGFDYMKFWKHSMIVGTAAKDIARRLSFSEFAGDAFVAGMLHDIGIQLMAKFSPDRFKDIVNMVQENKISYLEAERTVLGVSHAEIGGFMATKWNLPSNLTQTIEYHHLPSNIGDENITLNIVHLADSMTQMFDIGTHDCDSNVELDESIIKTLNFSDKSELEEFVEEYFLIFQDTADLIKL